MKPQLGDMITFTEHPYLQQRVRNVRAQIVDIYPTPTNERIALPRLEPIYVVVTEHGERFPTAQTDRRGDYFEVIEA